MRRPIMAVIGVAIVLTTAGCGGDDTTPDPSTTTTTNTTAPDSTTETPRPTTPPPVTDPIDLRPFFPHPCATLTTAQQNQLGLHHKDPDDPETTSTEFSKCIWLNNPPSATDDRYGYGIELYIASDPLADAYAESNDRNTWTMFEPQQIRGLPAVVRSIGISGYDDNCEVIIGTGNGQGVTVSGTLGGNSDPALCGRLTTAAEWVIDAVRG